MKGVVKATPYEVATGTAWEPTAEFDEYAVCISTTERHFDDRGNSIPSDFPAATGGTFPP